MGIEEEFGRAARILRKRQALTLQDMAERGFDRSYLCEVEKGLHNPGLRYIGRLAEGLEVGLLPELGLEEGDEAVGMVQSFLSMLKGLALELKRGIRAGSQG